FCSTCSFTLRELSSLNVSIKLVILYLLVFRCFYDRLFYSYVMIHINFCFFHSVKFPCSTSVCGIICVWISITRFVRYINWYFSVPNDISYSFLRHLTKHLYSVYI